MCRERLHDGRLPQSRLAGHEDHLSLASTRLFQAEFQLTKYRPPSDHPGWGGNAATHWRRDCPQGRLLTITLIADGRLRGLDDMRTPDKAVPSPVHGLNELRGVHFIAEHPTDATDAGLQDSVRDHCVRPHSGK